MSAETDVIRRIVDQNLAVYRASPSRLQEDVSQEAQVASDYRGRLVYELLQNADDAMAEAQGSADRVAFLVTDHDLWIANDGRALTDDDVQGLCGLGASSKVDTTGRRRASIGHKGLGFKSVLEVTDEPTVHSRTYSFTLGQRHALPVVTELWESEGRPAPRSVPAMRFPVPAAPDDRRWADYTSQGFNTAFRFPFRDSLPAHARRTVAELLLNLPLTTVLFLKHLERVEVRVEREGHSETRTWELERDLADGEEWRPTAGFRSSGLYRVTISSDEETASFAVAHDADVAIGRHRVGLSGPAWEGVDLTEVSVAAPLDRLETVPESWRRFHVFLPTAEACQYPFLVNGAFSTDLSRQQVRVASEPFDYNAHLVRQAARLVRERVLPVLARESPLAMLAALDRADGVPSVESSAAELLHQALIEELRDVPLLPTETGSALTLGQTLLPPSVLDEQGEAYRAVLPDEAMWEGRYLPSARFCAGRWARIAADHGGRELTAAESLRVLAGAHDPARATTVDDESGGFELDPLLELCSALWHRTTGFERAELETQARMEPLFPVRRNEDRTLERIALADDIAFYPPRSARQDLPLRGLRFMSHAVCWGALNQNERLTLLAERMKAWTSLFGVREFRFETVVQAAITPALHLHPDPAGLRLREQLETEQALAAVCQLAGRATKPDRPLRYQRHERALFNLTRLPVPCRSGDGELLWLPAYRVYFGEDWIGSESVECIARGVPADDPARDHLNFTYLAPPDTLLGLLDDGGATSHNSASDDDEVDENEDVDEAIETDARDRWIAFLAWLGVNKALRPVHFHDVDDDASGWLTTKNLVQPRGWAFAPLDKPWRAFERSVRQALDDRSLLHGVVPYFYEVHDLDQLGPLMAAIERDATNGVADAFFAHLARHWSIYQGFSTCHVALVEEGKWPSQRNKPQRALPEELEPAGDNLWLHRLKRRGICPTSLGPRQPSATWQPSAELERRFRRRNRSAGDLLPVLQVPDGVPAQAARSLAERLDVRADPSPSTFRLDDARILCERLETITTQEGAPPLASQLREIKPVYRQLFELLSGQSGAPAADAELGSAHLLADTPDGFAYLPARAVLYASTPGIRERSGVAGQVPTFVLEAEPGATAPLTRLFGLRTLEAALEWRPDPGECSLTAYELEAVRDGLRELTSPLLARIRVERTDATDFRLLREFVERVEPVDDLRLSCTLDGVELKDVRTRPYFVSASRGEPLRAFVVWGEGRAWPPQAETAQALAMALADALGLNLVETFLAFIQSDDVQRRQLLDIAGGAGFLGEVYEDLADAQPDSDQTEDSALQEPNPTPAPGASEGEDETPVLPTGGTKLAPPRVPLFDFEQLTIDGDAILIFGDGPESDEPPDSSGSGSSSNGVAHGGRAAVGTDLRSLDALGMRIAVAHEVHRLRRAGCRDVELLGPGTSSEKDTLVVDVHTPTAIVDAEGRSPAVQRLFADLERQGISALYPGFDILVMVNGTLERAIELKSSGVDARVQTMSWNEWKTAGSTHARENFWLYLVGNLRADLGQPPFVRCIRDPFGSLAGDEVTSERRERAVQLRVREFAEAELLELGVSSDRLDE